MNLPQRLPQKRYFIGADFDDTLFETSKPSPNGMNVKIAYGLALDSIFGEGTGEFFFEMFGLKGRSPSQIIKTIIDWYGDEKIFLIENAYKFYNTPEGKSVHFIPESPNGEIPWDSRSPERTITQMLIGQKLKHLINEVGQRDEKGDMWPPPCKGAMEFLETVSRLKAMGIPIDLAIISSGHETFIRRTLNVWGLKQPDILITEDDVRSRTFPKEMERRAKPGQLPIALAHREWLRQQGLVLDGMNIVAAGHESKQRMMYVGDNPTTDVGMTLRARLPLSYLYPFTPWEAISDSLIKNSHLLDGRPFGEIVRKNPTNKETDVLLPNNLELKYQRNQGSKERF